MVEEEVWLPVPSHELLEASSWGRIRSLEYVQQMPRGGWRIRKLNPTYGVITYNRKGQAHKKRIITFKRKTYKVARLVCAAFNGPPPSPDLVTLHGDEDSMNNRPGNLSWGTQKENLNAPGFIAYCKSRTGENSPVRKGQMALAAAG